MAYIGQDIEGGVLEKQTLAFDSVTTTFELDYYSAENGLVVSVGGIIQEPGVAFTVNGKNIVFALAPTQATFVVFIERELTIGTVKALDYVEYQSGTGNATTTPVTLNNSVTNPEEIMVSLNGITQIPTTDYTVSGTTLTFDEAPVSGTEIFILFLRLETTEGVLPSGHTLTDSKIVSLDAGKLTGSLPNSFTSDVTPQWHALNSVGMHWMNLENKTKMNLVQSYYDHFEDDTGWLPYNGTSGYSAAGTLEDHSNSRHTLNMGNGGPALVGSVITDTASVIKFDGSSHLSIPDHTDWEFGTNDFTVELWYKASGVAAGSGILGNSADGGWSDIGFQLNTDSSGRLQAYVGHTSGTGAAFGASGSDINSSINILDDNWHHLALVRYGDAIYGYLDGTLEAKKIKADLDVRNVSAPLYLGKQQTNGGGNKEVQDGTLFDEIRVSNVARYTANFTPQTTKFTSDANTKLLVHADSTSESILVDSSSYSRPITLVGSPTRSTAQKKFGDTSVHLESNNGTSNHIWIPDSDDFDFGTEDFTIETWAYLTAYPTGSNSQSNFFGNATSNSSDAGGQFVFAINGPAYANKLYAATWKRNGSDTSDDFVILGSVPSLNQWNHLAMVRDGTNIRVYVNGVQTGVGDIGSGRLVTNNFASDIHIGKQSYNSGYGYINGYIDEHRISNICRYPSGTTFTPHTSAHVSDANTLFLLSAEGGSQSFTDSSSSAHPISNTANSGSGGVKHELLSKVAASAMDFSNATNKYFYITNHSDFHFGTGDWTIEFWAKFNAGSHHHTLWDQNYGSAGGIVIQTTNANPPTMQIKVDNGSLMGTPTGMALDTWHHIAVVRASGQMTYYLNGKADDTQVETGNVNDTSENIWVGFDEMQQSFPVKGSMDEIRVSDVARYTADFTPQTTVFTPDANTKLLIHGEAAAQIPGVPNTGSIGVNRDTTGEYISTASQTSTPDLDNHFFLGQTTEADGSQTFTDQSSNSLTVTVQDDTHWDTGQAKFGTSSIYYDGDSSSGDQLKLSHADTQSFLELNAWTYDCWIKTAHTDRDIFNKQGAGSWDCIRFNINSNNLRILLSGNLGTWHINSTGSVSITDNEWHHVALVVDGSSWKTYIDGVNDLSVTSSERPASDSNYSFLIGGGGTSNAWNGYIQMPRMTTGARWSSNFTPPVLSDYTVSSSTTNTVGTLISTSTTANATVSEASGIMMYADATDNTSTIGTDLKVHFSSDDGANWTEAASYDNPITFDGTTKLLTLPKTTLSGGTGTAVKMKAEFANQQGASSVANTASAITANGDVKYSTALSDSPVGKIGSSAIKFDGGGWGNGTAHYFSIPDTPDLDLTGDFTVEMWFKKPNSTTGMMLLGRLHPALASYFITFRNGSGDTIYLCDQSHGNYPGTLGSGLNDGEWHHIAHTRNGTGTNNIKFYIDGVQVHQYSGNNPIWQSGWSGVLNFGTYGPGNPEYFGGFMDEIRISDSCRYTANFTPSTEAFVDDSNTLLLIHSNGESSITDSSSHNRTITTNAGVNHHDTLPPVGSSSISFGGNANTPRLTIPNEGNPLGISGYHDFTIEGWFLWDGTGTNYARLFNLNYGTSAGSEAINLDYYSPSNTLRAHASTNGASRNILNSNNTEHGITANTWFHVAMVRLMRKDKSKADIRVYINGKQRNWYFSTAYVGGDEAGATFAFGGYGLTGGSATEFWHGHMDELRISNMARYIADFTPTKTKFVADSQTTLLIHADQPNNSVAFTSDEIKSYLIQPVNDVKHSNYVAKIGNSGIKFDGSGDRLEVAASSDFQVASSDPYTIEFWFKMNITGSNTHPQRMQFMGGGTWASAGTPSSWVIDYQHNTNSDDQYIRWARYGTNASYTWGYAADTEWHHLAIVMPGDGTQKLYLDGTYRASASVGDTWHTASDPILIGMSGLTGQDMNGYMDEIRISDVARYSANFTPSTTAFSSDANTLLLIHSNENSDSTTFTDSSSNNRTITTVNNVTHTSNEKQFSTSSIYFGEGSNSHQNYITIPARGSAWDLKAGNWTVEWWMKSTSGNANSRGMLYYTAAGSGKNGWFMQPTGNATAGMCVNMYSTGSPNNLQIDGSINVSDNTWHHAAFVRNGDVYTLYADGQVSGTFSGSGYIMPSVGLESNALLYIGTVRPNFGGPGEYEGWMDEIRISNSARYTGAFTPPTTAFTTDGNTLLLLHGDGSGNLITDDSYTTGKQTQLHGWAVNY